MPREKPPRRRHTSMRAPFAPLTNAPRRVRPRALSQSSESESEHDENDRHLAPVGDVIGAAHPRLRREFVTLSEFAFDLQNGSRDRIDVAREQLREAGLFRQSAPVLRKEFYNTTERAWKFKFACADWRTCGCGYYVYVLIGGRDTGTGSIEEPVNNIHNAHVPTVNRRTRATAEQKTFIDGCVRDGAKPSRIMRRLEEAGLDDGLDLRYIQRYKPNHKAAVLGQAGFLGTVQEYEDLLDTYSIEDNAHADAAGIVHWELEARENEPVKLRVIISSQRLIERLSTEIIPGILGWCVDGTYKLNREGHVTVPIGVFDLHRKFYLCAFAIVPGPGENESDFQWIAQNLQQYLPLPGRETRHSRPILHLVSDSSAGLISGISQGLDRRDVQSQRCWFHVKKDLDDQIARKVQDRRNVDKLIADLCAIHDIAYPMVGFYDVAFDAWERRWSDAEPEVVQYVRATWRGKHWSFAFSMPGFPTTNNGVESKNAKIKETFRREKLHLRDAIQVLAGLIETEVRHVNADFDTSLPTMNRSDYIEADTWIRNKLNKDPLRRIEVDSERSLYPTHEFLAEIDAVLTLSDASDDDRSEQRRRIIHSRLTIFLNFYEHTMLRGRAPSRDDPAYKFKSMLSLARAFHVVTKLPQSECSESVLYRCTCVQTSTKRSSCSYAKHRECTHVFVEGIKRETLQRQRDFIRVHELVAPGRPARMPPALVRETPARVINQFAAWGIPMPEERRDAGDEH